MTILAFTQSVFRKLAASVNVANRNRLLYSFIAIPTCQQTKASVQRTCSPPVASNFMTLLLMI